MKYQINGIALEEYGVKTTPVNSSFGLSGIWDLPARGGKTFHNWGNENGIEPYVDYFDIWFLPRNITLNCSINESDGNLLKARVDELFQALQSNTENLLQLRVVDTGKIYRVYLSTEINVEYLKPGCADFALQFIEPFPVIPTELPGEFGANGGIDGIPFRALGIAGITETKGLYSRPAIKALQYTGEGGNKEFSGTKTEAKTIELSAAIKCQNLTDFGNKVDALQAVFSAPGLRKLKLIIGYSADVFAASGFTISNIYAVSGGIIADFKIKLYVVNED